MNSKSGGRSGRGNFRGIRQLGGVVNVADAGEAGFVCTGSQVVSLQTEKAFKEQLKIAPSRDVGD